MDKAPTIDKIVVHVTQGSWASAINWSRDPNSGVSTHYAVRSGDGRVAQSVREKDIAHHAGNWEYSQSSIGIEHEGYVEYPEHWFTEVMYHASARLAAYLCEKYGLSVDREHIIGHDEVPHPERPGRYGGVDGARDPGPGWDWERYMNYVRRYASGPTG